VASKEATEVRGSETAFTGPFGRIPTKAAVEVPTGWMGREPGEISSMGADGVMGFGVRGLEGGAGMGRGYSWRGSSGI
jgi:hypothetical protein